MPETILLFRLFVGAPSDVDEALVIVRGQIEEWNRDHGPATRARVEFMNWRTHSHPAAGARPQAILNEQLVDHSDIVVAVFQARFGTPTGVADSGTEEESAAVSDVANPSWCTLLIKLQQGREGLPASLSALRNSNASWADVPYSTPSRISRASKELSDNTWRGR